MTAAREKLTQVPEYDRLFFLQNAIGSAVVNVHVEARHAWLVLVVYALLAIGFVGTSCLSLATWLTLCRVHRRGTLQTPITLTLHFVFFLAVQMAWSAHCIYMLQAWTLTLRYPFEGFLVTGLISYALKSGISITVFFLGAVKCLELLLAEDFSTKTRKFLFGLEICALLSTLVLNFGLPLLENTRYVPKGCVVFVCLSVQSGRQWHIMAKMSAICLVTVAVTWLFFLNIYSPSVRKFTLPRRSLQQLMNDELVGQFVFLSILYDLTPHLIEMLALSSDEIASFFTAHGPLVRIPMVVGLLATSCLNWRTVRRVRRLQCEQNRSRTSSLAAAGTSSTEMP